ncbi:ArnT family glycosyltransferase [Methanobacterium sp.]|uniref:ArnT family glycosyltransferase n=1 Tax=Methanobacterium sp. TaxID=2164 RepID=UPI003C70AC5B
MPNLLTHAQKFRLDFLILLILGLLVVITRVPFTSKFLYEWDSVNYSLAFENYNILQQQPHPPGYLLYVALGKAVNYIFNDPNTSLIFLSITFSILSTILIYFMAKEVFSRKIGIISALLLIFNPFIWFYGEIASIYIFEAFFSILIAYSSYKLFKGDEKFIYISAFVLGLSGGFRTDIIEFMLPLWAFSIWNAKLSYAKISKGLLTFLLSISLWLLPAVILTGGFEKYIHILRYTSESASYTSLIFGASISQQILNTGVCIIWSLVGLTLLGILITALFLTHHRENFKPKAAVYIKKPLTIFFLLWIIPSFIFYLFIYIMKPGYLLTFLPAVMIILSYITIRISSDIHFKFPKIHIKHALGFILIIYIISNTAYFAYPYNLHNDQIWETPTDKMGTNQKIWFGIDVGLVYDNSKINANDENTQLHIQNILNISGSDPQSTIIVIRDITREDEGFNWRKAMYYLPGYDIYYLFDHENSGIEGNVSVWHGKNHSYNISKAKAEDIKLNSSTTKIVWVMSNQTSFYQEVKDNFGVNEINLSNGMKLYYSYVGNQTSDIKISSFIFGH